MGTKLQLKRGTAANILTYTPDIGELVYDIDNNRVYIGDNSTPGGIQLSDSVMSGFTGSTVKGVAYYVDGTTLTVLTPSVANSHDKLIGIGTGSPGVIQVGATLCNISGLTSGRLFVGAAGALVSSPPTVNGEYIISVGFGIGTTLVIQINNALISEVVS